MGGEEAWQPIVEAVTVANLTAELVRELQTGHPLFGIPIVAVFLGPDSDDVLFRLLDGSGRLAVVHLTWRGSCESLPWPHSTFYEDEADWQSRGLADEREAPDA